MTEKTDAEIFALSATWAENWTARLRRDEPMGHGNHELSPAQVKALADGLETVAKVLRSLELVAPYHDSHDCHEFHPLHT